MPRNNFFSVNRKLSSHFESRRTGQRHSRRSPGASRRTARFEPLEDRRLLALSAEWLGVVEGSSVVMAYMAAHDAGGFSTSGRFTQTVNLDAGGPGEVTFNNPTTNSASDILAARYSDAGELLWARQIGSSNASETHIDTGVAVDRAGNTYVLGMFGHSVQIGSQTFTGDGADGFVAKLDADGNFVWGQALNGSLGTNPPRVVHGIAVDDRDANPANWSVFVSGYVQGTLTVGSQSYTTAKIGKNSYALNGYVSKMSAAAGTPQWTQLVASQGGSYAYGLSVAETGDPGVYVSGQYATNATIGNVTVSGGSYYLAKLNPASGATLWAKTVAVGYQYGSIAATSDGIMVNGHFGGTIDMDPGPGVYNLTSDGDRDVGILKLDSNGNFSWAQQAMLDVGTMLEGSCADAAGNIYITGTFRSPATFGSIVLAPYIPSETIDAYVAKISPDGEFVDAFAFPDAGRAVGADAAGNVYVASQFSGWTFEHFPTGDSVVAAGFSSNAAVMKFSTNPPPIDPTPRIDRYLSSHERVLAGTPVKLKVIRVHDPVREFETISIYRDNGDGVLNVAEDELLGADSEPGISQSHAGWVVNVSTEGFEPGVYTLFALASNAEGTALAEAALDLEVYGLEVVSFASANVPKAIPDKATMTSTLSVPESFNILDVDVTLNITHPNAADLDVYLIGPDGTRVTLFLDVGGTGDNFTGTILDSDAAAAITSGTAPFAGRFRPQGSLNAFDGKNSAGIWTLEVADDTKNNKGTLNSWSLQFTREMVNAPFASGGAGASSSAAGSGTVAAENSGSAGSASKQAATGSTPAAATATEPARLTASVIDRVLVDLLADRSRRGPAAGSVTHNLRTLDGLFAGNLLG